MPRPYQRMVLKLGARQPAFPYVARRCSVATRRENEEDPPCREPAHAGRIPRPSLPQPNSDAEAGLSGRRLIDERPLSEPKCNRLAVLEVLLRHLASGRIRVLEAGAIQLLAKPYLQGFSFLAVRRRHGPFNDEYGIVPMPKRYRSTQGFRRSWKHQWSYTARTSLVRETETSFWFGANLDAMGNPITNI